MTLLLALLAPPAQACSPVDEPTVRWVRPADGATDVPVDARLLVQVGQLVSVTEHAVSFALAGPAGDVGFTTREVNNADGSYTPDRVVEIVPAAELTPGATYTLSATPTYGLGDAAGTTFQAGDVRAIDAPAPPTVEVVAVDDYKEADDFGCFPSSWAWTVSTVTEPDPTGLGLLRLFAVDASGGPVTPDESIPLGAWPVPAAGGDGTVRFRTGADICVVAKQEDWAGNRSEFSALACPPSVDGADTGSDTGDTGADTAAWDTGADDPGPACGCTSGGGAGAVGLAGVVLAAAAAARRRPARRA